MKRLDNENFTVSEALHLWLESKCGEGVNDDSIFCSTKLIAYMLDHRFKGKLFNSDQLNTANRKILWMLREDSRENDGKSDYSKYIEYINSPGEFFDNVLDELTAHDF